MIEAFTKYSGMDVTLEGTGDIEVDAHHLVEDVGLVLGAAVSDALGDRNGIRRFGEAHAPLDESLVRCVVDYGRRPHVVYAMEPLRGRINDFDVEVIAEFIKGYAQAAGATHSRGLHSRRQSASHRRGCVQSAGAGHPRGIQGDRWGCAVDERDAVMPRVGVCDYGVGNLRSVERALRVAGAEPVISGDPDVIAGCDGVVLPGVGAFSVAAGALRDTGLGSAVRELAEQARPVLGVCLGHQLLFEGSDEGQGGEGLALLRGHVVKLAGSGGLKVPHMGWNTITNVRELVLLDGVASGSFMYFVHSYVAVPEPQTQLAVTQYGASSPLRCSAARDGHAVSPREERCARVCVCMRISSRSVRSACPLSARDESWT